MDIDDSPIRINPSNDYLSVSADLTIQPGVVVQVAWKGISFDGTCDEMKIDGNEANPVTLRARLAPTGRAWRSPPRAPPVPMTDPSSLRRLPQHQ